MMGAKSDNYALSGINYAHKLRIIKAKMASKSPFLEHRHAIYRWKGFFKLILMMGTKSDDYALSGLNYVHKLCIIKAKMTKKSSFLQHRHVIYRWKGFLKLIFIMGINSDNNEKHFGI